VKAELTSSESVRAGECNPPLPLENMSGLSIRDFDAAQHADVRTQPPLIAHGVPAQRIDPIG